MYYHGGYPPNYPVPQQHPAPQPRPPQPQPINEQSLKVCVRACVCVSVCVPAFLTVLYTFCCRMPLPSLYMCPSPHCTCAPSRNCTCAPPTVQVPLPLPLQQLKEMFPQMDEEVFRSVLEANGGNVELSINQLLTMS